MRVRSRCSDSVSAMAIVIVRAGLRAKFSYYM